MTPPATDFPAVLQHGQSSPQQTGGRHVADHRVRTATIPEALLQQIKCPPKKKHHRVESLSQTFEEEIEESFHNLESGDFGLKQT